MDKSKYTPMMQHYLQLKEENPDAILMYRLGDFYEMFFEDAKTVSRELDLVLTGRAAGTEKAPMCGVPFRAAKSYITRLVRKGYKVAICEQLEDPREAQGLVERGIVQIVTPGTLLDDEAGRRQTSYLAAVTTDSWKAAIVLCELSTGELRYHLFDKSITLLQGLLSEFEIREVLVAPGLDRTWQKMLQIQEGIVCSRQSPVPLQPADEALMPFASPLLKQALEVLTGYLDETQKQHADHLMEMTPLFPESAMVLDPETRSHLELTRSQSSSSRAVSLWEFMDRTKSAMGSRLLKEWIEAPLLDREKIRQRQDGVEMLCDQFLVRSQLEENLSYIYDIERLAARISYRSATPRDLLQLASSLSWAGPILELAGCLESYPQLASTPDCHELAALLSAAIVDEPPLTTKDGGYIAPGFSEELDGIRALADQSDAALMALESRERERTGIKNLKIGYNRVFGYYVEIRKTQLDQIRDEFGYTQKQTLASASRFVFDELKELEEKILAAQEQKVTLEQQIFDQLLERVKAQLADLHQLSRALALIDVLTALASLAVKKGYVRPEFTDRHEVCVLEGRHPVLEERLPSFVSNSWIMDPDCEIALITGPNMGGKSTWLRQNALIVIMAQMGSFVPARSAKLPVFDRIFTRIGASDDLLQGKSTFMVEMMEANNALRHASENSLILFDEIGRGTATYDGMALARSMIEYITSVLHSKTLFSTHYHELTDLEEDFSTIRNVHVDVRENHGDIEFRYRIIDGKADKSYGIHVARLAGLPPIVITRARALLDEFEQNAPASTLQPGLFVMDPSDTARMELVDSIRTLDIDDLSPREALQLLYQLKKEADAID